LKFTVDRISEMLRSRDLLVMNRADKNLRRRPVEVLTEAINEEVEKCLRSSAEPGKTTSPQS